MDLEPLNVKISIGSKVEMLKKFQLGFFLWPLLRENHKDLQKRRGWCRLRSPQLLRVARSEDDGRRAQTANRAAFGAFCSTKKDLPRTHGQGPVLLNVQKRDRRRRSGRVLCFLLHKKGTHRGHTARVLCFQSTKNPTNQLINQSANKQG